MPDTNQSSERGGNVPQNSESFGNLPNDAAGFRNLLKPSERKESHTLSVREVARMFEAASVARTERSITNWCHPNKLGVSRLDAYFDPNEKKFFVTPQSVELAIKEEQARAVKSSGPRDDGRFPSNSEVHPNERSGPSESQIEDINGLKHEIMDLRITNRGKDFFIEQLQKERKDYVEQLMVANRHVGELETRLLQLESPDRRKSPT